MRGRVPFDRLAREIAGCTRCRRLRAHCLEVARVRRRAYRDETYWGIPVPGFGDPSARVLIVGLAPAAHGANRTGRMFTGDSSGTWLARAMHGAGLASGSDSVSRDDGLALRGAFVTAACRCAPPGNRPLPAELASCAPFLEREIEPPPRGSRRLSTRQDRLGHGDPSGPGRGRRRGPAADAGVRPRRRSPGRPAPSEAACDPARLLSPEPSEHADRQVDEGNVRVHHPPRRS